MGFVKSWGKDSKIYYFKYEIENQPCRGIIKICFKTTFVNQKDNNWFDFKLTAIAGNYMVVSDMFDTNDYITNEPLFKGKGLPEALILEAQRVYPDKIIISATGEALWEPGRAVWRRLVIKGLANYDDQKDFFILKRQTI